MDNEPSEVFDDDDDQFEPVTEDLETDEVPDEELNMIEETTPPNPELEGEARLE